MRKEKNGLKISFITNRFPDFVKKVICGSMALFMVVSSVLPVNRVIAYSDVPITTTDTSFETEEEIEYATTEDTDYDVSQVNIVKEADNLRTQDTKTFLKQDGTFVTAIYAEPVHYLLNGKFEDIDNTLSFDEKTNAYATRANSFSVQFPGAIDSGKMIQLTQGDYSIGWKLVGLTKSASIQVADTAKSDDPKEVTKVNQSVTYSSVMDGVDVEYIVTGSSVKENILLNKYRENLSLSFTYALENLSLIEQPDGTYVFADANGKPVFSFASLYMYDAKDNISNDIKMTVIEIGRGEYQVTITPDSEWLKTAVYPVTIDPTISSSTIALTFHDTYIDQQYPNTQSYYNYSYFYIAYASFEGRQMRGLLKFSLPDMTGKTVVYSYLTLTKADSYIAQRVVDLYQNTANFSESTVTWNTQPTYETSVTDFKVVETGVGTKYIFDITESCKEWAEGISSNYGFTIKDQEDTGNYTRFYSSEHTTLMPVVEIGYVDTEGLKNYWTYSSQDAGEAGTGYVSDYSGYMNLVRNDISFSTAKQNLGLSFAYSVLSRNTDIGYGKGWNIIYNTQILFDEELGLYYTKDYTGNIVYYHLQPTPDDRITPVSPEVDVTYLAEDGSGDVYVRQFASGYFGGQYILSADNIRYKFGTDSYLDEVTNLETGCCIVIARNPSAMGQITQITDISGNKIVMGYTSSKLSSASLYVKKPDTTFSLLEKVEYKDEDGISGFSPNIVEYHKNYIADQTLIHSLDVLYTYDTSYRLTDAYVEDKTHIQYLYTTSHKVDSINGFYDTSAFFLIDYGYSVKRTTFTDQSGNYVIYKFDDYGHTVNILDNYGNVQTFSYFNLFYYSLVVGQTPLYTLSDGTPNYSYNNKVVSQSAPEATTYNPINNPSFEYNTLETVASWRLVVDYHDEELGDVLSAYYNNTNNPLIGSVSAKLNVLSTDRIHLEQTVVLDAGTYVLTGYARNDTASDTGIFVDVVGEDNPATTQYIPSGGEWTYFEVSFGILNNNTVIDVWLAAHALGNSYFDCIQLLEGFTDTRANMVNDPSFEIVDSNGNLPLWTISDSTNVRRTDTTSLTDDLYESILGDYGIRITGSPTQARSMNVLLSQFFDMTELQKKGKLIIGAWGYSNGAPTTVSSIDITNDNPRFFRIRVVFLENLVVRDTQYINFDTSVEGWQYVNGEITAPSGAFNYVRIYLEYQGEGTVYFDGLQAFFEQSITNYYYNSYGQETKIQTSEGNVTSITYPENVDYPAKPTNISQTDGTKVDIVTDTWSDPVGSVTYNNVKSTPTYNSYGQVTLMTVGDISASFSTSTYYIHLSQYVRWTTDEYGETTQYTNDYLTGLLTAIENAKGQDTHYIYDDTGKLVEVRSVREYTDPENVSDARVIYMYDELDRLEYIIRDTNFSYRISYDTQGRMDGVYVNTTPLMTYTYEMEGTFYTGLISTQTYGNGDSIKFLYDEQDRVSEIQFKNSGTSTYVTRFGYKYDQAGRIGVYETYEDGDVVKREFYTYDSSGNLRMVTDSEGNKTEYVYDKFGNLTTLKFFIDEKSSTTDYAFECSLLVGGVCMEAGSLYDKTDYTTESSLSVVKDYHYETGALHRLDFILLTVGTFSIKQDFTFIGTKTRISEISYDFTNDNEIEFKYTYAYDSLGNIIQETYYDLDGLVLAPQERKEYEYDVLNQLIAEDVYSRDGDSYSKVYVYDHRGNRTSSATYAYECRPTNSSGLSVIYLDNTGEVSVIPYYNTDTLFSVVHQIDFNGAVPSFEFTYHDEQNESFIIDCCTTLLSINVDPLHKGYYFVDYSATNWQNVDVAFSVRFKVGNLSSTPGTPTETGSYVYDDVWLDQLNSYVIMGTSHVITYDAQGNPETITNLSFIGKNQDNEDVEISAASADFEWMGRQLTSITFKDGSNNTLSLFEFKYNDQGYRIETKITQGANVQTITYHLNGDKVIYETDGDYGILFTYDYDGTLISFNYDSDVNDATAGEEYFYLRNQQGDITLITNSAGVVVMRYRFDAYGNMTATSTSGYDDLTPINPYTYRGYRYDYRIGLYYLNSRFYNPQIGRFINSDGLLGETGDILSTNMYAYCANNPVMYTDITGYLSEEQTNYILAGLLLATLAVVAAVCPTAAIAIVSGVASAIGQVISNKANGQPLGKNVVGALIGGTLTIAFGPVGIFIGAALNTGLNAFENKYIYNEDYSYESIIYQFVLYSASNALARYLPFGDPLYSFVGYTVIDSVVYSVTDWAQEYVIDFVNSVKGEKR